MRKLLIPPAKKAWGKLTTKLRFKLRGKKQQRQQHHHHLVLENNGQKKKKKKKKKQNRYTSNTSSSGSKRGLFFMNHIKRTAGALSSVLFLRRNRRPSINRYSTLIRSSSTSSFLKRGENANVVPAIYHDMFNTNNHRQQQCQWVPLHATRTRKGTRAAGSQGGKESPEYTSTVTSTAPRGSTDDDRKKGKEQEDVKMEEESDEELLLEKPRNEGHQPLVGIDLRAELFITSFRKEMRLQQQKSFTEYQEMLGRSV